VSVPLPEDTAVPGFDHVCYWLIARPKSRCRLCTIALRCSVFVVIVIVIVLAGSTKNAFATKLASSELVGCFGVPSPTWFT